MKKLLWLFAALSCASAHGQGFVFDQQSADENTGGGGTIVIQTSQILGQSFTPTLSSIGFIRLKVGDTSININGATAYVNLRTGSISGPILDSTATVSLNDGFFGDVDFLFSTPVSVTPGVTYFFQPVLQSDDFWATIHYNTYNYPGGMEFTSGNPQSSFDLWFREGIVVPEPSTALFLLLGSGMLWFSRKKFVRR